ncbi:MAG: protease complex subunit PrcB family protein [Crocinitomicaceae bacterium]|nr:protease complex subunit PrcB family protein [Crocinitomicaceae bacterium]
MKKKHILYLGLALGTMIGIQSCKVVEETGPTDTLEVIETSFKEIANNSLHGNGAEKIEEGVVVINSEKDWNALRTKMNSVNQSMAEKSIDFKKNTVLVYFDGIKGSGGHTVEVKKINELSEKLYVVMAKKKPKGDAIEIMTQPYCVVLIDKTDKTISFTE